MRFDGHLTEVRLALAAFLALTRQSLAYGYSLPDVLGRLDLPGAPLRSPPPCWQSVLLPGPAETRLRSSALPPGHLITWATRR